MGFIALACFLLFGPPFAGTYLLGLRLLALLIDLLLVSVVSFLIFTTFSDFQQQHQGLALSATLWVTFFYFVILDSRFKGTLGKKLCGLKVAPTADNQIDFCKSFLRVFLTFLFPIICCSYLQDKIVGDNPSPIRFLIGNSLGYALIFLIPISIIFLGGNQSFVDKLLGISVHRRTPRVQATQNTWVLWIKRNTWALLVCSTVAFSFLFTGLIYLGGWRVGVSGLAEKPPAKYVSQFRSVEDPTSVAKLWALLPMDFRQPTSIIKDIEMFDVSPNPFSFRFEDSRTRLPLNPEPYFAQLKQVRLVKVSRPRIFLDTEL